MLFVETINLYYLYVSLVSKLLALVPTVDQFVFLLVQENSTLNNGQHLLYSC